MKKNILKLTVYVLLITLATTSCDFKNNAHLTQGSEITQAQLYEYSQDTTKAGKRYSFTGYFSLNEDIDLDRNKTVHLNIFTAPDGKGTLIYPVMLDFGKHANEFYAPDKFTSEDLKLFDNAGNPLGYKDKIKVSFTLDLFTDRARKKMLYFTSDDKGFVKKHEVYAYPFDLKDIRVDRAE